MAEYYETYIADHLPICGIWENCIYVMDIFVAQMTKS